MQQETSRKEVALEVDCCYKKRHLPFLWSQKSDRSCPIRTFHHTVRFAVPTSADHVDYDMYIGTCYRASANSWLSCRSSRAKILFLMGTLNVNKMFLSKSKGGRSKNRKSRIRSTRMRGNLCTVSFLVLLVFCRHRSHTWINVQRRVAVPLTSTGFSNTLTRIRTCYASRYFHTLWATPLCPRSLGYT